MVPSNSDTLSAASSVCFFKSLAEASPIATASFHRALRESLSAIALDNSDCIASISTEGATSSLGTVSTVVPTVPTVPPVPASATALVTSVSPNLSDTAFIIRLPTGPNRPALPAKEIAFFIVASKSKSPSNRLEINSPTSPECPTGAPE